MIVVIVIFCFLISGLFTILLISIAGSLAKIALSLEAQNGHYGIGATAEDGTLDV